MAKTKGVYCGRARRLDEAAVTEVRRLAAAGVSKAKIARDLGCSRWVFYDAIAGTGAYAPAAS